MIIGIPKEIMKYEGRVAITPDGVKKVVEAGHKVLIQSDAGEQSGYTDDDFTNAGAEIKADAQSIYQADMIVKVKEPLEQEYELLKQNSILFAFVHLPANPKLLEILIEKNITAIAYEGIELENKKRPLLGPMSDVAGKSAVLEGMHYLRKENGGKGVLPDDAKVVILGAAGIVGQGAVQYAKALNSSIIALDLPGKLEAIQTDKYTTQISTPENIEKAIKWADLVIGAIAIPGAKAQKLVSKELVSQMEPGSVIADVAIDEGGCVETSHPTTQDNPVFTEQGIIHYCVKNIPGTVPRTSTPKLTEATLPYILEIVNNAFEKAISKNPALMTGTYIHQGKITNEKLAETFGKKYTPIQTNSE
jgi:alanine dehydrogenase